VDVAGCLTEDSCRSLFPVIRRALGLAGGGSVTVDLSRARHIEPSALDFLNLFAMQQAGGPAQTAPDQTGSDQAGLDALLSVNAPDVLPDCAPAGSGRSRPAVLAAA
jgi:hypothetical protein